MAEVAQQVIAYLLGSPLLFLGIACLAGFAAHKSVASEGRSGFLLFSIVGVAGLFLSQFVILFFGLQDYLEELPDFRILFDLIAAYIGAFVVAAVIHFIKPL